MLMAVYVSAAVFNLTLSMKVLMKSEIFFIPSAWNMPVINMVKKNICLYKHATCRIQFHVLCTCHVMSCGSDQIMSIPPPPRYMVETEKDGPLLSMDLKEFILTVGARSPAPGGGSVAALTATLVSFMCRCDWNPGCVCLLDHAG